MPSFIVSSASAKSARGEARLSRTLLEMFERALFEAGAVDIESSRDRFKAVMPVETTHWPAPLKVTLTVVVLAIRPGLDSGSAWTAIGYRALLGLAANGI